MSADIIQFERFHFADGKVTKHARKIDSAKDLAGNALFQRLSADTAPSEYTAPQEDPA